MKIKNMLVYIISFVLVFTAVGSVKVVNVFADTNVKGVVTALKGSVYIKRQGSEKKTSIYKNMDVSQGDTLITGAKSSLTIKLNSKEMTLGENTQIVIDELWGNGKAEGTSISLIFGSIFNAIKEKLNVNSKNEIKTPTAIIGVRGTKYVAAYSRTKGTQIAVLEGAVYATPANGETRPSTGIGEQYEAYGSMILTPDSDSGAYGLDLNEIDKSLLEAILASDAFSYSDKDMLNKVSQVLKEINLAEEKAEEERLLAERIEQEKKLAEQEKLLAKNNEEKQNYYSNNDYAPQNPDENDEPTEVDPDTPPTDSEHVSNYNFSETAKVWVAPDNTVYWNEEIKQVVIDNSGVPNEIGKILLNSKRALFSNVRSDYANAHSVGFGLSACPRGTEVTVDISFAYMRKFRIYIVNIKNVHIIYDAAEIPPPIAEEQSVVQELEKEPPIEQTEEEQLISE